MNTKNCDCKDCPTGTCECVCHPIGKKDTIKQVSKILIYVSALYGIMSLLTSGGLVFPIIGFATGLAIIYRALLWYKKRTGSSSIDETLEKARTEGASMFEHAKEKAETLAHDAKEMAHEYSDKAKETMHDVKESASEKIEDARDAASHTHGAVMNKIHEVKHDVKAELVEILDDAKEFVAGKEDDDKKDNA